MHIAQIRKNSPLRFARVGAFMLMKPGSKWKVFIPSELGYGTRGAGSNIGPNETLIFDLELLEIVK